MDPLNVGKSALKAVWANKALWVFGFFVAGATAAGSARGGGMRPPVSSSVGLPGWVIGLVALGVVLGIAGLVLHVICDAALVDGIRRARSVEPVTVSLGLRAGAKSFGRLVRVKLLALAMFLGGVAVLASPAVGHLLGGLSMAATLALTAPLVLVGVPVLLSIWFMSIYAARIAVLEEKGSLQSFREARDFLSGRVRDSLLLLLVAALGQLAGAAAAAVTLLPAAVIGGLVYLVAGIVPALVVGGLCAAPLVAMVAGATGAFQSAVWTTAYLEGRAEAAR